VHTGPLPEAAFKARKQAQARSAWPAPSDSATKRGVPVGPVIFLSLLTVQGLPL
jgi:hypothetical protein